MNRIRGDPQFSRFAGGRGTDKKKRDLQLNIDYMCKVTGSSNYYFGRDLKTSHIGLGITETEWESNLRYMSEALDHYKIPSKEREEVIDIVKKMKQDIVEK